MKYTYKNRKEINDIYTHDSFFTGYSYDYLNEQIRMTLVDEIWMKRKIYLTFNKVVFAELQAHGVWGDHEMRLYDMWSEDESIYLEKANKIYAEQKEENPLSYKEDIKYIHIIVKIVSGDELNIICENMECEEEK